MPRSEWLTWAFYAKRHPDVLNRFVTALGGAVKLIADFGDEQLKID